MQENKFQEHEYFQIGHWNLRNPKQDMEESADGHYNQGNPVAWGFVYQDP